MATPTPTPTPSYRSDYWQLKCAADPSIPECVFVPSYYHYAIWLPANAVFAALFGVSLLAYCVVYAATRRGLGFFIAMFCGVLLEILGYAGRAWSAGNHWLRDPFLMQIICLTIGPAFLAAGVYLCLRRIVSAFGPENSRIRPEMYTRIFIPCDVISLLLQSVGGALVATREEGSSSKLGDNVMIAGLAFQVATLFLFMACATDFALRVWTRYRRLGPSALSQDHRLQALRSTFRFRGFLVALAAATVLIFWRSIFRVAEMAGGWDGELMARQDLFVAFEGVLIVVACLALDVFHPAVCMRELFEGEQKGGMNGCFGRKRKSGGAAVFADEGKRGAGNASSEEEGMVLEAIEGERPVTGYSPPQGPKKNNNNPYGGNAYAGNAY